MDLSTTSAIGSLATTAPAAVPRKELGKDDFLRLLTTQLSNQDPLKPVDNQAFIAQLAQFASVEQLQKVGSDLETLLLSQTSQTQLSVAGLVGKEVLFRADGVDLAAGGTARLDAQLSAPAQVTAVVQDGSGRTVRTLALGARQSGPLAVEWDGLDDAGNAAPAGHYRVVVTGRDASGAALPVDARTRGVVDGAAFGADGPLLLVGGARVKLSDVVEIHQG